MVTITRRAKKSTTPRTYVVVKNPKTNKAVGMTVHGLTAEQVLQKITLLFSQATPPHMSAPAIDTTPAAA